MKAIHRMLIDCRTLLTQALHECKTAFTDAKEVQDIIVIYTALGAIGVCIGAINGAITTVETAKL